MKKEKYFLGLDIGTDSVGYAVTDTSAYYKLLKHHGEPMWGSTVFDAAELRDSRRAFRTARRRLDRRQQRILLLQEICATEIEKTDSNFYKRIKESALLRIDASEPYCLFNDAEYTDKDYHKQYPTIHHLIIDLIENKSPHDIRLVYLACAWLLAHRGHFLNEISCDEIDRLLDFRTVYNGLTDYFCNLSFDDSYIAPWNEPNIDELQKVLKMHTGSKKKYTALVDCLFDGKKPNNDDNFPFNRQAILNLLAGGSVKLKDLYVKNEYEDLGSFNLGKSDDDYDLVLKDLGDDGELLKQLKSVYDWIILSDILSGEKYISKAKVKDYETHKNDLKFLKSFIKKYIPQKYNDIFKNSTTSVNYVAYSGNMKAVKTHIKTKDAATHENFCSYIYSLVKDIIVEDCDKAKYEDMKLRLELKSFMPCQVTGDNRVIPYQVYYIELAKILENASAYLPFLKENDKDGYNTAEKILSIMKFRVPYYVGPLNKKSTFAWLERKADGKITPWNFEEKVDLDKSEQLFISKMTNKCSYIAGEDVLPKHSLLYEKFEVLNEINCITVNGERIPAVVKQEIFNNLFMCNKKVSPKKIKDFLVQNNYYSKSDLETFAGLDDTVKSSLSSHFVFRKLLEKGILSTNDVEKIIERSTYSENKPRFSRWLENEFSNLSNDDRRYIASLKFKDFGRLSKKMLCEIYGAVELGTGECKNIINMMWDENLLLMELLSDKYKFTELINSANKEYYSDNPKTLDERLDEMYISNSVKRPIYRTLSIVDDVVKICGHSPEKIFIEMARGTTEEQKNKRTVSRKQQLLDLYKQVKDTDVKLMQEQLEAMGDTADNKLQSEKLFLYYLQLGKSAYSGITININELNNDSMYNVDHIYPQAKIKDDSILNNKVLVLSTENGAKGDSYPIRNEIRSSMYGFWQKLREHNLMTEEKFKRLTRSTPFSDEEKWNFINRQLVETRQSTKAVATLLKERLPETEIVYVKAGIVSEFRHEFNLLKSRKVNDLHHAKDAYLNIVCGNVYNGCFTKQWFAKNKDSNYSVNPKTLFNKQRTVNGNDLWLGEQSISAVKNTVQKNNVHYTQFAYCKKGGLFDQQPLKAKDNLIPRKKDLPVEIYGGYNSASVTFFVLVRFSLGKKREVMLVPISLMDSDKFFVNYTEKLEFVKKETEKIVNKTVTDFEILLNGRILKIGTVFELDGLRVGLASKGNGGDMVGFKVMSPLCLSSDNELYIKHIESFSEKIKKNKNLVYSSEYDRITKEENKKIYELLLEKAENAPFVYRPESQSDKIRAKLSDFDSLSISEQCNTILNILTRFNRSVIKDDFTGCTAACRLNAKLSNWKKKYKDVRIVDTTVSGLYEHRSDVNLLDLL